MSENDWLRADRFLLEIGEAVAPDELRSKISIAICRLLRADSAGFHDGRLGRGSENPEAAAVLAAAMQTSDDTAVWLVVKRTRRRFRAAERALFRQVVPHIRQAWRNAQTISAAARSSELPAARVGNLTSREHEVLRWISAGKRNSEVATILEVSPRTIEKHLEHVFAKLGVETRTAAVHEALELTAGHRA